MSVESLALVLHHSRARGTDKLILLGIANHDGDGGAWPSISTLARYANVDESSVRRAIRRLEQSGELFTDQQAGGAANTPRHRRPNLYRVLVSCPVTCDHTSQHRLRELHTQASPLWINPQASTPGGGVHAGGGGASTPGVPQASTPAEPSLEPTSNPGSSSPVPTDRARLCDICSREPGDCQSRAATSGHAYTPKGRDDQ